VLTESCYLISFPIIDNLLEVELKAAI